MESNATGLDRLEGSELARSWSSFATAAPVAFDLGLSSIGSAHYCERRLGAGQHQIDYLVAFSRGAADALGQRLRGTAAAGRFSPERWAALARLIAAWGDGSSRISTQSPTLWLEFDDQAVAPVVPVLPSVSMCLVPAYRPTHPVGLGRHADDLATARDALSALRVHDAIGPDSDDLRRSFEELPDRARWIHLSVMLGRTPCAVKLYGVFNRADLLPYLDRIDWCGDRAALQSVLDTVYGPALVGDEIFVDLNLDTFRDPWRCTLGLAVAQQHLHRGPVRDRDRAPMLRRWVKAQLCTAQAAGEVMAWVNAPSESPVERFLDLKLTWQAGGSVLAKAYLGTHRRQRFI